MIGHGCSLTTAGKQRTGEQRILFLANIIRMAECIERAWRASVEHSLTARGVVGRRGSGRRVAAHNHIIAVAICCTRAAGGWRRRWAGNRAATSRCWQHSAGSVVGQADRGGTGLFSSSSSCCCCWLGERRTGGARRKAARRGRRVCSNARCALGVVQQRVIPRRWRVGRTRPISSAAANNHGGVVEVHALVQKHDGRRSSSASLRVLCCPSAAAAVP